MTKEELTKVPFKFMQLRYLRNALLITYKNDKYDMGFCIHRPKRKDGVFGRTYRHYRFRDKVYKTLPKFLEAIKELKFNETEI